MSENKNSVLPDVIEPISNAIQQNIPETAKQTDGALSTVVGFFNNVVLYPVKKANLTFRYKLEAFEDDLKEKIKNIPLVHETEQGEYWGNAKLFRNMSICKRKAENIGDLARGREKKLLHSL